MIFLDCYDSDGLTGYGFSHEGFWSGGYELKRAYDAYECADLCDKDNECIAFSYRYGDNKQCIGYKSLGLVAELPGISRAYVKCVGMSKNIWLPC